MRIDSAATSSPVKSAEPKVFHTYRSASCVHNRIRVSPARLVSPCVKAVKCYALLSPESEGMQDAQVRTGGALFSSCDSKCPTLLSLGGQLFLCDTVSFSSSVFGDQSPRNLRSYWCALSSVKILSLVLPLRLAWRRRRIGLLERGWV